MTHYLAAFRPLLLALCLVLISLPAQADPERSPEQVIRHSVETMMNELEGREDYYANNLDELKALVDDSLDDIADFRYIGASVMDATSRTPPPSSVRVLPIPSARRSWIPIPRVW